MGFVSDVFDAITGKSAAKASEEAAGVSSAAQQQALDYLKETEKLPMEMRDKALGALSGLYGLQGPKAQEFVSAVLGKYAEQSPIYSSIKAGQKAGEESILRQAGATGGLRSGNVNAALADYNTQLEAQARQQAYQQLLSGLQGFAGYGGNTNAIANTISGIGQTQAAGITGAAQAQQQGVANLASIGLGIADIVHCDPRLKKNIKRIGHEHGFDVYSWEWNEEAEKLGLHGTGRGFMADEVQRKFPEAVYLRNGFLMLNYSMIKGEVADA